MTDLREKLAASVGGMERLASMFSARTMGDLNRRAEMEIVDGVQVIEDAIARTEKAIKADGLEEYHSGSAALERVLIRAWAMYQHAGSRTLNWFVTGASNFPVHRNQKRMDTEHKRYEEFRELAATAPARAVRIARATQRARIGAGGLADLELQDLKRRLAGREADQARMKATNEVIRKHKLGRDDAHTLVGLMEDRGYPVHHAVAHNLLTPDYGSAGFPRYMLSNNNAEIHRLRDRIAQVEVKCQRIESAPDEPEEREINGVRIVYDHSDDRVRLIFPGKPAGQIIQMLKGRGFRWSPSNGAWQRQLTQNARTAAAVIAQQVPV